MLAECGSIDSPLPKKPKDPQNQGSESPVVIRVSGRIVKKSGVPLLLLKWSRITSQVRVDPSGVLEDTPADAGIFLDASRSRRIRRQMDRRDRTLRRFRASSRTRPADPRPMIVPSVGATIQSLDAAEGDRVRGRPLRSTRNVKHGPSLAILLVGATQGLASPSSLAVAGTTDAVAEARRKLAAEDGIAAVAILEEALPGATATTKDSVLALLQQAYEAAARQAQKAGRPRDAETYRENPKILNRKLRPVKTVPNSRASRSTPAATPEIKAEAPPPLVDPSTGPTLLPEGSVFHGRSSPPGSREPSSLPVADVSPPIKPEPPPVDPSKASTAPDQSPLKPMPAQPPVNDLANADAAFSNKDYREAGGSTPLLARTRQLPAGVSGSAGSTVDRSRSSIGSTPILRPRNGRTRTPRSIRSGRSRRASTPRSIARIRRNQFYLQRVCPAILPQIARAKWKKRSQRTRWSSEGPYARGTSLAGPACPTGLE